MRKTHVCSILLAATMTSFGCSSTAPAAGSGSSTFAAMSDESVASLETTPPTETAGAEVHDPFAGVDLAGLPAAPWAEAPLATDAVPGAVLSAWASADNRELCAPIAPSATDGEARVSEMIEGGWAVEFDAPGMPGVGADGEGCARCGRGVFGIAGTAMSPDDILGEDATMEIPEPSFADGSHLEVEPPGEGESVAAAMLTIRGQGCVYQVWSFLGEDHVRELVGGLRRVDVRRAQPIASR